MSPGEASRDLRDTEVGKWHPECVLAGSRQDPPRAGPRAKKGLARAGLAVVPERTGSWVETSGGRWVQAQGARRVRGQNLEGGYGLGLRDKDELRSDHLCE